MSSPRLPLSARPAFLPDEIARREFATVFRGYDPAEVRTFLNQLSEQSAELSDRIAEIQKALAETQEQVKNPELDEEMVTKLLGEQTAQILRSAREAANDTRARAEAEVSKSLREAHEVTTKMREEAETLLAERSEEAERMAEIVRSEASEWAEATRTQAAEEAETLRTEASEWSETTRTQAAEEADRARSEASEAADAMRDEARNEAAGIRSSVTEEIARMREDFDRTTADEMRNAREEASQIIETARTESAALVERTQEAQAEMIEGLVRKRKIALAQVEQLRAGRQRLLTAYKMVRGTLDEVTVELERVEQEARNASDLAGVRAAQTSELSPEELESVIELQEFSLDDDVSQSVIDLISQGDDAGSMPNGDAEGGASSSEGGETVTAGVFYDAAADSSSDGEADGGGSAGGTGGGGAGQTATMTRTETIVQETIILEDDQQTPEIRDEIEVIEDEQEAQKPVSRSSSVIMGESGAVRSEFNHELEGRREAAINKARPQAIRRLKRALQDEQEALVARMRNGEVTSVQGLLGSHDDQASTYHRAVVRLFREVVRSGAVAADPSADIDKGVADRTGTNAARGLANELVQDLRNQLEPVLEELLGGDDGVPDANTLTSLVSAPYREVKGDYLNQLVDDRIGGAFDQGAAFTR